MEKNNPIPGIEERNSNNIPMTRHPLPKRLNENSKPNIESQMKTSGGARNCIMMAVKVILLSGREISEKSILFLSQAQVSQN